MTVQGVSVRQVTVGTPGVESEIGIDDRIEFVATEDRLNLLEGSEQVV